MQVVRDISLVEKNKNLNVELNGEHNITKQAKRAEKMKNGGKEEEIQGWTYVNEEKEKEKYDI